MGMPTKRIAFLTLIFVSVIGYKIAVCDDQKSAEQNVAPQDVTKTAPLAQSLQNNHRRFPDDNNTLIDISTALAQCVYYPIGSNICRLINHNRNKLHMDCRALLSAGSFRNLQLLSSGEVSFAIAQSDLTRDAVLGSGLFAKLGPNNKLKLVAALHEEPLVIVVRAESEIKSLDDLAGKVINLGENISTNVKNLTDLIFKIKGWSNTTFKRITNFNVEEQPEALCNKYTDVMLLIAGTPNKIVQKVARLCEVRIIEITDPAILGVIENDGVFIKTTIPGGVYLGVPKDIETVGVKAVLLTTDATSEDSVYKITKTIVENSTYLKMIIQALANIEIVSSTLSMQNIVPLHEGSMKFYNENR